MLHRTRSRIAVIAAIAALSASTQASGDQPPETRQVSAASCSTEGGDIEVTLEGDSITYWKGSFCRSTDCTTFEVTDIQADGQAIVTVAGDYFDGGQISYRSKIRIGQPSWQPDAMMSMYYGGAMRDDLRQVQTLFELTESAFADNETEVRCR